jgi:hypothetical protein
MIQYRFFLRQHLITGGTMKVCEGMEGYDDGLTKSAGGLDEPTILFGGQSQRTDVCADGDRRLPQGLSVAMYK